MPSKLRTRLTSAEAVALIILFVAMASPAYSQAAATIGTDLSTAPTQFIYCGGGCTLAQASPAGLPLTSPVDGVIVRWRVRTFTGSVAQMIKLRVVRPGMGPASGAGTSEPRAIATDDSTQTYDTRLAIRAGDRVGLDIADARTAHVLRSGGSTNFWNPPLVDGAPPLAPSTFAYDVTFNADVEQDVDGDGFGDETQDACPAKATTQGACIVTGPSISGTTEVGKTLAVNGSSAQGGTPTYQWLRGSGNTFTPIPGATGSAYRLGSSDRGKRMKVTESVSNPKGSDAATSSPTGVVGPPLINTSVKKTQRAVKQRGVVVKVKSNLAGKVTATGTIALPKGIAKTLRFKRVTRSLAAGKSRKLVLRLSKKGFATLKRVLVGKRKLKARLTLVVKDKNGGRTTKKIRVTLKR